MIFGFFRSCKLIKAEKVSLKNLLIFTYFLAGNWVKSDKIINLDFSNKPSITAEIYPNENHARILLCTSHPEYMIWHRGRIKESDDLSFNCLAKGLHQWFDINDLSQNASDEITHTWWMIRRFVAWAAKVPDGHMPPIEKGGKTENILHGIIFDGNPISQIKSI